MLYEVITMENGGILMDTPGMRTLSLWESDEGMEKMFGEVERLVKACRFHDCTHQNVITSYSIHYTKLYERLQRITTRITEVALRIQRAQTPVARRHLDDDRVDEQVERLTP